MAEVQMHGKASNGIACKRRNLEAYEQWAKSYVGVELGVGVEGFDVKVTVDTDSAKNYFVNNKKGRQIHHVEMPKGSILGYVHAVQAKQKYVRTVKGKKKKKKVTVDHVFLFDVSLAINDQRKAKIEKRHKVVRVKE